MEDPPAENVVGTLPDWVGVAWALRMMRAVRSEGDCCWSFDCMYSATHVDVAWWGVNGRLVYQTYSGQCDGGYGALF